MELRADGSGVLEAQTVVGVLRGLETLTQLVHYDGTGWLLPNLPLVVHDAPRLRWRGLLLDSARHFVPVPSILRLIDGMAGQCTSHSTASSIEPRLTLLYALPKHSSTQDERAGTAAHNHPWQHSCLTTP